MRVPDQAVEYRPYPGAELHGEIRDPLAFVNVRYALERLRPPASHAEDFQMSVRPSRAHGHAVADHNGEGSDPGGARPANAEPTSFF